MGRIFYCTAPGPSANIIWLYDPRNLCCWPRTFFPTWSSNFNWRCITKMVFHFPNPSFIFIHTSLSFFHAYSCTLALLLVPIISLLSEYYTFLTSHATIPTCSTSLTFLSPLLAIQTWCCFSRHLLHFCLPVVIGTAPLTFQVPLSL